MASKTDIGPIVKVVKNDEDWKKDTWPGFLPCLAA